VQVVPLGSCDLERPPLLLAPPCNRQPPGRREDGELPRGLLRPLLHYETLAFSQEPDPARTSFQERERYATAFIGIGRRSPGGQAPGG
jgi:hypothetical protein